MTKLLKKMACALLAVAMIASLAACGGSGSSAPASQSASTGSQAAPSGDVDYSKLKKTTVILASAQSSGLDTSKWLQEKADEISKKTGGQLTIQLQFDGKLGGDTEEIEAIQAGDIDMMLLGSSAIVTFVPEVSVFDMPMMFDDAATASKGVPQMAEAINKATAAKGIQTLGIGVGAFRTLSTNKEIKAPADFKGMKIRTLENKYHMDFWQGLGSEPTPIAFTDLYLSLSQGLVQAQDNPVEAIAAMKFYEVQDYYMPITAFPAISLIIASPEKFGALDPAYQALIQDMVNQFMAELYDISSVAAKAARESIGDQMTDLEYTDEIKAAMVEAAKPVWKTVRKDLGDELVDAYLKIAGRTE